MAETQASTRPAPAAAPGATMRAIRKLRPEPGLTLCEDVPVPDLGPHDVLVRVEATSICGTDLHIYNWDEWSRNRVHTPLTLGHEFAGTIARIGSAVEDARVGDFVSAESHVTCGHCFQCRTGQAHMCPRTQILGVDRDGAFADYVAVPSKVIWKNDPEKMSPEIATLQEPFGNAVFAALIHDLPGKSVAIFGCGPIGLFSVGICRASGAASIFAFDINPYRLQLAKKMGATWCFNPASGKSSALDFVLEHNRQSGVDVVLEMSGAPQGIADTFRVVRNGGRVTLFGIPAREVKLDVAENIIFKNLTVFGLNGREIFDTWYKTRWLLETGVVDLNPLITLETTFDHFEEAFSRLASGNACKIIMRPGGEAGTAPPAPSERQQRPAEGDVQGRVLHR